MSLTVTSIPPLPPFCDPPSSAQAEMFLRDNVRASSLLMLEALRKWNADATAFA